MRSSFFAVLLAASFQSAPALAGLSLVGTLSASDGVFIQAFTLPSNEAVAIQSFGYGGSASAPGGTNAAGAVISPGGFEPHLSLFAGTGAAATFVASGVPGTCPPATAAPVCADPTLDTTLPGGDYTLAVSDFSNLSFAENYGSGTLGDGFTGFVYSDFTDSYGNPRTGAFAVDVVFAGSVSPVPAPGPTALAASLVLLIAIHPRKEPRP